MSNLTQQPQPPQTVLDQIIGLYNQGQLEQTVSLSESLAKQYPNALILYDILGAAYMGLKNTEKTIASYQKALQLNSNHTDAYNNMGMALYDQGRFDDAVESYKKAINLEPGFADAHYNLGNALQQMGDLKQAIESYKASLALSPDDAEVLLIFGNALKSYGNFDQAIEVYARALTIDPTLASAKTSMEVAIDEQARIDKVISDYARLANVEFNSAEIHNLTGKYLISRGYIGAAMDSYIQAVKIKPNLVETWHNILIPFRASNQQNSSLENFLGLLPEQESCKEAKIASAILKYQLYRGRATAEQCLREALKFIGNADNNIIKNPIMAGKPFRPEPILPKKIIALLPFGRSGTGLLHSLIDGHSEISTLPSHYLSQFFDRSNWEELISGGWNEMADRFIAAYEVLFDASFNNFQVTSRHATITGQNEGMANVGEKRNEVLYVDKKKFKNELTRLMCYYDQLDAITFFKLVHSSYNKALEDNHKKRLIFYHIHTQGTYSQLNFLRLVPNVNWLIMVREPLQSCESWLMKTCHQNDYNGIAFRVFDLLFEIGNVVFKNSESIGVRLEDLKAKPTKTLSALCAWLGINQEDSLYEMTAQGKKWWGDPTSPDYEKDGMNPFGQVPIQRKVGILFSKKDQFILQTLLYPFSVRFGYVEENFEQFKINLVKIRPMLNRMFDFEQAIAERTQVDNEQFMRSETYLYLRSGLIERWNTLSEFHTYPNMLRPLKVS